MPEEIAIGTLPMREYKAAREEGKETVSKQELESDKSPAITGREDLENFKAKRDAQEPKKQSGGFQKRIDVLTKRARMAEERLSKYENGNANGNGGASEQSAPSRNQSDDGQEIGSLEKEKIESARQRYADFDAVAKRSENQQISIAAGKAIQKSPQGAHIFYVLARDDKFRTAFNNLSIKEQVREISEMEQNIAYDEDGKEFSARVRSELSDEELGEMDKALKGNKTATEVIRLFQRDLNELPNPTEVYKRLVRDPKLSSQLAAMSYNRRAFELGRISQRLEDADSPRRQTAAPIKPVFGGSTMSSVPMEHMSLRQYKKAREGGRLR
jgi:hypothetical protein